MEADKAPIDLSFQTSECICVEGGKRRLRMTVAVDFPTLSEEDWRKAKERAAAVMFGARK